MDGFSRRRFLGVMGAAVGMSGVGGAAGYVVAGAASRGDETETVLRSENGVLRATLTATTGTAMVAGRPVANVTTYNGLLPGPTMYVKPGDRLQLRVRNRTDLPTNMHYHGFHVSPKGRQDNVFLDIKPGWHVDYDVEIPDDHPGGLYWYHPHRHGTVGRQVYGGLCGLLVVEGGAAARPEIAPLQRRLLSLRSVGVSNMGTASATLIPYSQMGPDNQVHLVNGEMTPTMRMAPGETQFWQVGNMASDTVYELVVPGGHLQVVEEDGVEVWQTWTPGNLVLPPGKRFGLLVTAPESAGRTVLRTNGYYQGPFGIWPELDLAHIVVEGKPQERVSAPAVLNKTPDWVAGPVAKRRMLTLGESATAPEFWFNDVPFDQITFEDVFSVRVDTTEEWVIRNGTSVLVGTDSEAHPYHQHVNGFAVVERGEWNPATGEILSRIPMSPRSEMDTTLVQPNQYIRIRTHHTRYLGRTVYHCHILFHEDHGMMGIFDIVDADGNGVGPEQDLPTQHQH